jgi:hypothetical protein
MKDQRQRQKPTKGKFSILRQICNFIPNHLVPKLARETGVADDARTYTPWSHVLTLLFAQLTHSLGLNDVCDALALHSGPVSAIRGATAPKRNTLSHANRKRNPILAEKLFWQTLEHLQKLCPGFGRGRRPRFALVDTARHSDAKKAWEVCAGLLAGEIVVFDKAYLDLLHLFELFQRGVSWVTRVKEGMQFRVIRRYQRGRLGNILRDDVVQMKSSASRRLCPAWLRRVVAMVEVDGTWREMEFLSDNLEWSAQTIVDLYRCRWQIEVFFKEIKQTLQLADFLGHNANAVRWQVWTALLTYVLLRFCAWISTWGHSFTRLFTLLRSALWLKLDLRGFLESYGTAGGRFRFLATPDQAYLPGIP